MRRLIVGFVVLSMMGCDTARDIFDPARFEVSCRGTKNEEIAFFKCETMRLSEGLVLLDQCRENYSENSVVLNCPVLILKINNKTQNTKKISVEKIRTPSN
jgi:hypothetical protein